MPTETGDEKSARNPASVASLSVMDSLGLPVLVAIFAAAAMVVWLAGIRVSEATDLLSRRLGWGTALGGMIALAIVTNLPEMAIVISGAQRGDTSLALSNILGGIAAQTVVLAILDRFGPRGRGPLMFRAATMTLVLEGLLVLGVLAVVLAGTQLPASLTAFRLTPATVLIAALWVGGVWLIGRYGQHLPWSGEDVAGATAHTQDSITSTEAATAPRRSRSTRSAVVIFIAGALATLVAGVVLERTSDAIATDLGWSGAIFGATVLAAATSLPEISTGLSSLRLGDDSLAVSDIFGGNAFLPVLFLPAVMISGAAILPTAARTDIYLTAVAMLLTVIYLVGLIVRPQARVLGLGLDSALVVVTYAVALAGLAVL